MKSWVTGKEVDYACDSKFESMESILCYIRSKTLSSGLMYIAPDITALTAKWQSYKGVLTMKEENDSVTITIKNNNDSQCTEYSKVSSKEESYSIISAFCAKNVV